MMMMITIIIFITTPTTTLPTNICLDQIEILGLTILHIPAAKTDLVSWHLVHFLEEKVVIFLETFKFGITT